MFELTIKPRPGFGKDDGPSEGSGDDPLNEGDKGDKEDAAAKDAEELRLSAARDLAKALGVSEDKAEAISDALSAHYEACGS